MHRLYSSIIQWKKITFAFICAGPSGASFNYSPFCGAYTLCYTMVYQYNSNLYSPPEAPILNYYILIMRFCNHYFQGMYRKPKGPASHCNWNLRHKSFDLLNRSIHHTWRFAPTECRDSSSTECEN